MTSLARITSILEILWDFKISSIREGFFSVSDQSSAKAYILSSSLFSFTVYRVTLSMISWVSVRETFENPKKWAANPHIPD